MATGPTINLPIDLSSLANSSAKIKELKKEVKSVNKDIEKLVKAGQAVPSDLKQKYQAAQKRLDNYYERVQDSRERVRESIAETKSRQNRFIDGAHDIQSKVMSARFAIRQIQKSAHDLFDERRTNEVVGKDGAGDDIRYKYSPSNAYRAAEFADEHANKAIVAGLKMGGEVGALIAIVGAVVKAASKGYKGFEDKDEGEKYKALIDGQLGNDFRNAGAGGQFGRQDDVQERLKQSYMRAEHPILNAVDNFFGRDSNYSVEDYKAIRAHQNSVLSQVTSLKNSALDDIDLGRFSSARKKMLEAKDIDPHAGLSVWEDPATLFTQRQSALEASKSWARSQMRLATNRSGD